MKKAGYLTKQGLLTKAGIKAIAPVLEDLMFEAFKQYTDQGGYNNVGVDYNGYVSIQLLNGGLGRLWMMGYDFDHNIEKTQITITGTFALTSPRAPKPQAILVDVTALMAPNEDEPEQYQGEAG